MRRVTLYCVVKSLVSSSSSKFNMYSAKSPDMMYEVDLQKSGEGKGQITTHPSATSLSPAHRVYKRRWVMLVFLMVYGLFTAMSWIQYAIIANVIMRYYNVSSYAVDWTSMVYMLMYVPLIFPALYILDKKGLRVSILIGTFACAVGSCIKIASVNPDRFAVAFVGQTLVGMSEVFLLSVPPKLAAVWFGADQVSTACSLAVCGNQFGIAMGFFLPPVIVRNHANLEDIGSDLSILSYGMAAFSTILFLLVVVFFKEAPPIPPSVAQILQKEAPKEGFFKSMKRLMLNRGYILLVISNGIVFGVMNSVSTLLNQLIMRYFEDGEQFAGRVGLLITVGCMVGSVVGGVVLDKTHKYKETTLGLNILALVGMLAFTFVLALESELLVYLTAFVLGCSLGGFMPVGFELAMELTYPEPEGTSAGILLCIGQGIAFVFTLVYGRLLASIGDVWSNSALCGTLVVGIVLTAIIPQDLRRQAAAKSKDQCDDVNISRTTIQTIS